MEIDASAPAEPLVAASSFPFGEWIAMGGKEWAVVAVPIFAMTVSGVVLPVACQVAGTVVIATFDRFHLIRSPLIGYFLFAETPDPYAIPAMFMIAGAGVMILRVSD